MEFQFDIARNPRPPFGHDEQWAIGQQVGHIAHAAETYPGFYNEYVAGLEYDPKWPAVVRSWHRAATTWMPAWAYDWWLPWFEREPGLEAMPLGWWRRRALVLIAAMHEGKPVGAGALTIVIGDGNQGPDQTINFHEKVCYEIRGVVIESDYRGQGLFKQIVERLLEEASELGEFPTFLATRNSLLRRVILRQTFTAPLLKRHEHLKHFLCWCSPRSYPWCDECPMTPGTSLWWDTDKPLPSGERHRFDYQD